MLQSKWDPNDGNAKEQTKNKLCHCDPDTGKNDPDQVK
jgi:hypothetical protein